MITATARRPFTASVLAALQATGKPVGDGILPAAGGWQNGVNGISSSFRAYVVLSEIRATHSSGPLGDTQADWQYPYLIESYGAIRDQCSWMAEKAREALLALRGHHWTVDSVDYGVQQVHLDSLGEPERVDAVQPPIWHLQDGITLWVGKGA